jgi:sister-chromatid-cohesion protein PDS5
LLTNTSSKFSDLKSAKLFLNKLSSKYPILEKIIHKSFIGIFGFETVTNLFQILKDELKENEKTSESTLELLQHLSSIFPYYFSNCLSELIMLIEDDDEILINKGLIILENIGHIILKQSISNSIKKRLLELIITGTPSQSKHSIIALSKIFKDSISNLFSKLLNDLLDSLKITNKKINTILKALGYLAEITPLIFETQIIKITQFIEQILSSNITHSKKTINEDKITNECQSKILSIKLLVHYLKSRDKDYEEVAESTLLLFFKIIQSNGEITIKENTIEIDRAYLRITCAYSIIKLCRFKRYEEMISTKQFQMLSLIIQDKYSSGLRLLFAKKLYNGLNSLQLPLKYISIFSLVANDSDKDILHHIHNYLKSSINLRREIIKGNNNNIHFQYLPEYVLPYLIHLLSHHPNLEEDSKDNYKDTIKYLSFFLEEIFQADNFTFLIHLLYGIKHTKDVQDPTNNNIHIITEIALKIIKKI